jgi:hypothetical protein
VGLCLHSPYFLILYRRKTLPLHNTEIFYTEFYSVESERVLYFLLKLRAALFVVYLLVPLPLTSDVL